MCGYLGFLNLAFMELMCGCLRFLNLVFVEMICGCMGGQWSGGGLVCAKPMVVVGFDGFMIFFFFSFYYETNT